MIVFFDTECYPNFWLFRAVAEDDREWSYFMRDGKTLWQDERQGILSLFAAHTMVSFNGNHYDIPMIIGAALCGYTTTQLKSLNDAIIVEGRKPWELGLPEWKPNDHIDIFEVIPGMGSQKQFAARIHCKKIQDLPYDPGVALTDAQITEVIQYCGNDLDNLRDLYAAVRPQIDMRIALSKRYGVDLRSKSDAQIAETVLRLRCGNPRKPEIDWNLRFKYEKPTFISFTTAPLHHALSCVENSVFRLGNAGGVEMPPEISGLSVKIGANTYKLGIGGLHSQEQNIAHRATSTHEIVDNDVASYYPSLILNSGRWPAALGPRFLAEYRAIRDERLQNKREAAILSKKLEVMQDPYDIAMVKARLEECKTASDGGKISSNGSYGKTGSPYSILFAPQMLIQTTITGQLSLLMLIERLECAGIHVLSANTDGITTYVERARRGLLDAHIAKWQLDTGLEMEQVGYKAVYSRDVNNYFAITIDGKVKRKGQYAPGSLMKNPDLEICSDAVAAYLKDGIPVERTICACTDIRKFLTVRKVSGGAVKRWGVGPDRNAKVRDMEPRLLAHGWRKEGRLWTQGGIAMPAREAYVRCFEPQRDEYLGKVVRWYYSHAAPGPIVYAKNGNHVGRSEGGRPCMTLPDTFPDDVDYMWYIEEANSILRDVGYYQ